MNRIMAIVLAAGKGTRMESDLPKVLVPVAGRPMIRFVIDALRKAKVQRIVVVVGYKAEDVKAELAGEPGVEFALQDEQLGTGHAVMMCREQLSGHNGPVLVVTGDSPMLQPTSITALADEFSRSNPGAIIGTTHKADPGGLGRILRDSSGDFRAIVEQRDATPEQLEITEVNMSTYMFHAVDLLESLDNLRNNNAQREYYVTDCPGLMRRAGRRVMALPVLKDIEALSINNRSDLSAVEEAMDRLAKPSPAESEDT